MNQSDEFAAWLDTLDLPHVDLPHHKRQLKSALLSSASFQRSQRGRRGWASLFLPASAQAAVPLGALVLLALFTVFGLIFQDPSLTPHAHAQKLVQRALGRVRYLSHAERADIEKKIRADLARTLEEAAQANDLTILSKEEFASKFEGPSSLYQATPFHEQFPFDEGKASGKGEGNTPLGTFVPPFIPDYDVEKLPQEGGEDAFAGGDPDYTMTWMPSQQEGLKEPVAYLQYTDPLGREVTLGIDEEDSVAIKIVIIESRHEDTLDW